MPDHFHVLITVNEGMSIERAVQFIKGGFAIRAGKELGWKAPIWQRGFSEVRVLKLTSAEQIVRYIRENPVVARLACRAEDYPYSSACVVFALDPLPQGLKPISRSDSCDTAEAVS